MSEVLVSWIGNTDLDRSNQPPRMGQIYTETLSLFIYESGTALQLRRRQRSSRSRDSMNVS